MLRATRPKVLAGYEASPKGFWRAKEAGLILFLKAALDAVTDVELNEEAPGAAVKVASLIPEGAAADLLPYPSDKPPLYYCINCGVLSFLRSLEQNAESRASHRSRPMHFWSKPYKGRMRKVEADLLGIADACACSATIALSKIKHSNAGLGLFAGKTFQRSEVSGS